MRVDDCLNGWRLKLLITFGSFGIGWWLVPSKVTVYHSNHRYLPVHVYKSEYQKASGPSIFKGQTVEFFWEISPFDEVEEEKKSPIVNGQAAEQQWARYLDTPVNGTSKVPYIPSFIPPFYRKSEEFKNIFESFSTKKSEKIPKQTSGVVLLTYYRSGSSFLGQILNQHPDVFYHFEPLYPFTRDCSTGSNGNDGSTPAFKKEKVEIIENMLRCDMPNWRQIFMNTIPNRKVTN